MSMDNSKPNEKSTQTPTEEKVEKKELRNGDVPSQTSQPTVPCLINANNIMIVKLLMFLCQIHSLFMDKTMANLINLFCSMNKIISKLPEWHQFIYSGEHDVIFVTDSWLKDTIPTSLVDPEQRKCV